MFYSQKILYTWRLDNIQACIQIWNLSYNRFLSGSCKIGSIIAGCCAMSRSFRTVLQYLSVGLAVSSSLLKCCLLEISDKAAYCHIHICVQTEVVFHFHCIIWRHGTVIHELKSFESAKMQLCSLQSFSNLLFDNIRKHLWPTLYQSVASRTLQLWIYKVKTLYRT